MNSKKPFKPAPLPPFRAVTPDELRRLWTQYRQPDIRRLILEIERTRRAIAHIEWLVEGVDRAWREAVGGDQSALFALRQVLKTERYRGLIDIVPYPNAPNY